MERRDALKALASIVGASGATLTAVTAQDAHGVELVLLRAKGRISGDTAKRLKVVWTDAVRGTALEQTRVLVLGDGLDVEFVRTK